MLVPVSLQAAIKNPLVRGTIEQMTGITAERLSDLLSGSSSLKDVDTDQVTILAETVAKYVDCLDYGLEGYATEYEMRQRATVLSKTDTLFAGEYRIETVCAIMAVSAADLVGYGRVLGTAPRFVTVVI